MIFEVSFSPDVDDEIKVPPHPNCTQHPLLKFLCTYCYMEIKSIDSYLINDENDIVATDIYALFSTLYLYKCMLQIAKYT